MSIVELTNTDIKAINTYDSNYILNKGADYYTEEQYENSIEYYRLAAAMGNIHAISNLGYCYLYGRSIEPNIPLAISYFEIASLREDIDATYKLGDIYNCDKWVEKDREMALYYYRKAIGLIIEPDLLEKNIIYHSNELYNYPSLCLAYAKELLPDGLLGQHLFTAYELLRVAKISYKKELNDGFDKYNEKYNEVLDLLNDKMFNDTKIEFQRKYRIDEDDKYIFDEYDEDDE